jgi:hypothetical protein
MKSLILLAILLVFSGCRSASRVNDIQVLVKRLSASHMWSNGMFPVLGLPVSASIDQLVERVFEMTSFSAGPARDISIIVARKVRIPGALPDEYIAVSVSTDIGPMIVLLKYEGDRVGWWSRVYHTEPNQSLQTMTAAVTCRAAHAPRQLRSCLI